MPENVPMRTHTGSLSRFFEVLVSFCFIVQPPQIELLGAEHLPFFLCCPEKQKNKVSQQDFFGHKKKSVALHTLQAPPTELENPFLLSWKIQFILKRVHFLKRAAQQTAYCQLTNVCYYFWSIEYRAVHRNDAAAAAFETTLYIGAALRLDGSSGRCCLLARAK